MVDDFAAYVTVQLRAFCPKVVQYNEISDILQLEIHNALLQQVATAGSR